MEKGIESFWAYMIYDIIGPGLVDKVSNFMQTAVSFDDAWPYIETMGESIKTVAAVLLMIHFLCFILESATREQLTIDTIFKGFLKFIIGFFFVQNCLGIFQLLVQLGDTMMAELTITAGKEKISFDEVEAALSSVALQGLNPDPWWNIFGLLKDFIISLLDILVGMGITIIFWIIALAVFLVSMLMTFSRALELGVRALFAPIAVVDVFEHGTNGAGFKYLKKFLAVSLQGAVVIAFIMLISALSDWGVDADKIAENTVISITNIGNIGTVLGHYVKDTALKLAGISLMMKSQQICNDIVGA